MTNTQELILSARNAIGEGNSNTDWKIVPTEHAALFRDVSASFADVLNGARINGLAKMYEDLNKSAVEARDNFKNAVTKANKAIFCTVSLGSLLLMAGGVHGDLGKVGPWVVGAIGLLSAVSSGIAAMWLNQVKGGSLGNKWFTERARAEAKRLAYFKAVINEVINTPFDQLLAFEYTRRFLLDNQIDYFRDRGREHELAHNNAIKKSTQAVFIASTVTVVSGLLSMKAPQLAIVAGIGVIASAFSTLVTSHSSVNLDRRNADRYRLAKDQLEERKLDIDIYRDKVASGDKGATQKFFEPIFVTLTTDHKEFLDLAEQREMAIGAMEERLKEANEIVNKKAKTEA